MIYDFRSRNHMLNMMHVNFILPSGLLITGIACLIGLLQIIIRARTNLGTDLEPQPGQLYRPNRVGLFLWIGIDPTHNKWQQWLCCSQYGTTTSFMLSLHILTLFGYPAVKHPRLSSPLHSSETFGCHFPGRLKVGT